MAGLTEILLGSGPTPMCRTFFFAIRAPVGLAKVEALTIYLLHLFIAGVAPMIRSLRAGELGG